MKRNTGASASLFFIQKIPCHCFVLVVLIRFLSFQQSYAQDTSAWIHQFNQAADMVNRTLASQKLGQYYYDHERYEQGIRWAARGLPFAQKTKIDSLLWKQYDLLANLHDNAIHFDSSIHYMLLSLELKKKTNNPMLVAGTYNDLGVVYGEKTELVEQAAYYYEAKKIYDQVGDTVEGLRVAGNIASNLYRQRKFKDAIDEYHKLMPYLKRQPNKLMLHNAYVRMAICHGELGNIDSCFYYSGLEVQVARTFDNVSLIADSWNRRAYLCGSLDNLKDFKEALDSANYYGKRIQGGYNWSDYYYSLGIYHTKVTKQYRDAISNYYKGINYTIQYSDKSATLSFLQKIAENYALAGNGDSAYNIMLQAYALKDSIITNDGREKLAEMQTKYETEKKEAQIQLLDKENKLKQRSSYFLIGGCAFLAIVLITVFRSNQLKQKTNRQLRELNGALDEANQSKARLFSILSHDLRSPVSNLYSYLQLKKIAPQLLNDEKQLEKETQLQQSAGHLLETMEDILVWSKSQLDNFQPDKQIIPIGSIVKNILSIYQPFIEAKEITLVLPDRDLQLCTDEHMLQTILRNLIANAIKYTPDKGTIRLRYSETPSVISVSNSGNPIDVKIADSLFSWKIIDSSNHGYGLKISKALADKLDLSLSLHSDESWNTFILSV